MSALRTELNYFFASLSTLTERPTCSQSSQTLTVTCMCCFVSTQHAMRTEASLFET